MRRLRPMMGDWTRRRILARFALTGLVAGTGFLPKLALSRPRDSWNFGAVQPRWQPLEIARGDTALVPALVAGTSVKAILDSGSGASILDTAFATKLGFSSEERRMVSGLAGRAPVRLIRNVEISFGGRTRRLPFAVAGDLAAVSTAFGQAVDLLVGEDMLAGTSLALDFGARRFAILDTGRFEAGSDWVQLPLFHGAKKELYIFASVAGLPPAPLMLDLGSSTALTLASSYIEDQRLTQGKKISTAVLGGVGGVRPVSIFTTDNVSLGPATVSGIPTIGIDDWLSVDTVGNIGLPLIAQFDVVLDVTGGFLWLRSAHEHRLPILKDRSGLGLARSETALSVVHVAAGSSAAIAGWAVGDRIIAINGHKVGADHAQDAIWSWRFNQAGTIVKLVMATGETRVLKLADYF